MSDQPEYTLHCFAQSGNAYKPALYLELAGHQLGRTLWQPRFVDFFNGGARSRDYLALNPMGEVPVLEHDGAVLSQSGVILDYLVARLGLFGWRDEAERREILRWLLWDNHKFTSFVASYRFFENFAAEKPHPEVMAFQRARMLTAFKVFARHLKDRAWCVGERPTIADLSLAGYVFYDGEYGVDWAADFAPIEAWRNRIRALPGWRHPYDLMPGHPISKR